ncbi:MAG TPA: DUF4178 domain-containing protein [Candidatus Binatia bacterium]|jgi:hypothetical protein|nr:DUF4178 domain-containing protein [Candidatus Binatia bacterium]
MSFNNPTPLQLGMAGTFSAKSYRVAGRVVLGVEEAGSIYYWNEFNLQTDTGEAATLVYEVTERGPEWRWFEMFEPQFPMTAEDAATKRVGDPLNLDGTDVRVTLLETSRVYHIEGTAPEGVEVGDIAHYFNAESGNVMQVVSWTGNEVEFYHGRTIPAAVVAEAFHLPLEALKPVFFTGGTPVSHHVVQGAVLAVFVLAILFAGYASCVPPRRAPAISQFPAPVSPLKTGGTATLKDTEYRIAAHCVMEIAEVGLRFERHEYSLQNNDGTEALLIYGWKPGAKDWAFFTPLHPAVPVMPQKAAAVRWKQTVNVEGVAVPVSELFRSTVRQTDNGQGPGFKTGEVFYGFSGQNGPTLLLARWNDRAVDFYKGTILPGGAIAGVFQ